MIRKKTYLSIAFIFTFLSLSYGQQDQLYTQFGFNKLSLNPAFAGNETYHSITSLYRDQWNGFPGAPSAQMLSFDLARLSKKVGLGFTIDRQSIGITRQLSFTSNYAYKIKLQEGTISGGLSVGFRNLVRDFTDPRLVALENINLDNAIDVARLSKNMLNVGAGIYFNNKRLFAGISVPRLIKNDLELGNDNDPVVSTEVRHLYFMTGGIFPISEVLDFKPQFLLRWAENAPASFDLNFGLLYDKKYNMALTYRSGGRQKDFGESIDFMVAFNITEQIMMGVAYDFTLSKLRSQENGSIELLFNYRMIPDAPKVRIANPRYF